MRDQVEAVLEEVRPALAMHGGNVELVGVDEETGIVKMRFLGACKGCPMSSITMKMGIEMALMDAIPSVKEVVAVED
jgi:Fe-S cluster biogenesis protein NfuA